jgi:hypothetical protein
MVQDLFLQFKSLAPLPSAGSSMACQRQTTGRHMYGFQKDEGDLEPYAALGS